MFSWLIFISSSVAASGPLASKISHTFWIATRLRSGDAGRSTASSSWEFVTRRVSQDIAALPHRNVTARLERDLAAGRGSFVCLRSPYAHYLPKEPWLAETFESP